MKSIILSSLILGLAAATPVINQRQDASPSSVSPSSTPNPAAPPDAVVSAAQAAGSGSSDSADAGDAEPEEASTYDPTAVAADIAAQIANAPPAAVTSDAANLVTSDTRKRDVRDAVVCTTRTFNGPQVTVPTDSPGAFQAYQPFADAANEAAEAENVPQGYAVVPGFVNLQATAKDPSYLTYVSSKLASYNPAQCAAICDAMSGCTAFNIYYERVPLVVSKSTQVPDKNACPGLATSPSATLIKCAFYGMPLLYTEATNVGQFQGQFQVVMASSNAYVKSSAPSLDGYEGPVSFGNKAINAPAPVISHGFLRSQTFGTNVPYDPSLCATTCAALTTYNAKHGTMNGQACVFFDAYIWYKNGADGVFTCAFYGVPYGVSYATNVGQYNNAGDHWTVGSSYGYYLDGYYVE
ncbi:hypothetical protein QBC46DRAFT_305904 [Diplogelasinospora grovesii]|uniref:Uncharacterized protein n=1 Tax=Diplogelasinospora grovesii TaxID=303347 RepID=A0AAN6NE69_9PEZI|nr:hypothetical protein QBC46DRAFT_305904 [Diplogelasinospora grovesii]